MTRVMVIGLAWVLGACSSSKGDPEDTSAVVNPTSEGTTATTSTTAQNGSGTRSDAQSSTNTASSSQSTTAATTSKDSDGEVPTTEPAVTSAPEVTTADSSASSSSSAASGSETGGSETGSSETGSSETGETGTAAECPDGPLSEPLPGCAPEFEETGDYYADCVARINQLRWECQCLPPLERRADAEACADEQSQHDFEVDEPHAGIRGMICEPGGSSQNECPGYGGRFGIVDFCLQQMWDEGPGEDFQAHGHYINMSSQDFTSVACGTYTTPDGEIWAVQNFFR